MCGGERWPESSGGIESSAGERTGHQDSHCNGEADAKTGEILTFARLVNVTGITGGEKFMDDTEKAYGKALDKQLSKMKVGQSPGR